jgi:hypothetical protein
MGAGDGDGLQNLIAIISELRRSAGAACGRPVRTYCPIGPLHRSCLASEGGGLTHEIKYDGFRSARGSGYLAYGLIARKPGGGLLPRGYRINACKGVDGEINKGAQRSPTCSTIPR